MQPSIKGSNCKLSIHHKWESTNEGVCVCVCGGAREVRTGRNIDCTGALLTSWRHWTVSWGNQMFTELSLVRQTLRMNGFWRRVRYTFPEEKRMKRDKENRTVKFLPNFSKEREGKKCDVVSFTFFLVIKIHS